MDNKGKDIVYFTMFMENINNYIIIKMPASTLNKFSEDKDMDNYLNHSFGLTLSLPSQS